MGFGFDDFRDWIEDLRRTMAGGSEAGPNAVGNNSIQAGIVNPLKFGAEFSGITQAYKGSKPGAKNKDKALALLTMMGYLGGIDDATNAIKSFNKNVYGLHLNPETLDNVPSKIKRIKNADSRYGPGAEEFKNAFFGAAESPNEIPERALESTTKWGRRYYDGTASVIKTKARNVTRDSRSPVGYKTKGKLKVVDSIGFDVAPNTPEYEYLIDEIRSGDITVLDKKLLRQLIRNTKNR